jgi:CRISPR-associated protein Csx17
MPNRIELRGCAPAPLLHYLKALGILRLVAEQLDADVRAAWQGDAFVLETAVSEEELLDFFLSRYCPTPIVAPWNNSSGFYPKDKKQRGFVDALLECPTERMDAFKAGIRAAQQIVGERKEAPKEDEKAAMLQQARRVFPDEAVEWLDAAYVLGEDKPDYPPLLGSGGNDGRLDFTTNRMERILDSFPEMIAFAAMQEIHELPSNDEAKREKARKKIEKTKAERIEQSQKQLQAAMFQNVVAEMEKAAVGQFHPAGAGGANAEQGVSGESFVNPWDFLLALEGALVLASATVRKLAAGSRTRASFPFTVRNSAVGYGTAVSGEKVRAEIWLPLWSQLAGYRELAHIFGEGRVQFNSKQKRAVQTGFDFARAVAELGVDRGIDSFQRFAFIERNGQANLATPLGRFEVRERPLASRLYDFERWADRLRSATSDASKTPPRFVRAMKQLDEAMFALCQTGEPEDLRAVLIALGAAEYELANGEKFRADKFLKPLAGLPETWGWRCNDQSADYEIAAALASIQGEEKFKLSPLRCNLEGVDLVKRDWALNDKGVVWGAGTLAENLSAILQRRSIDARSAGASHPALQARRFASLSAIAAFLQHDTSDAQIENLLWGLMLVNWKEGEPKSSFQDSIKFAPTLPRAYALLKLLFLPDGKLTLNDGGNPIEIKHEPTIIPLLRAGRAAEAVQTAVRRLRAAGLVPLTETFDLQDDEATRLAAALLIPIHPSSVQQLARLVLRAKADEM